uniref:Virion structural protein n=1 Tax=Salmonella phage vB_SEnST11_KE23 TaxID=3161174 RepID=A0AAU8GGN9_9CAUD
MFELLFKAPDPSVDGFQYAGVLSQNQFISYNDLVSALAPTTPFAEQTGFKYFVFRDGNVQLVVPSHPIGRATYNSIYLQGAVFGTNDTDRVPNGASATLQNKIITVQGQQYRVRLMNGVPGDTHSVEETINTPSWDPQTEFDQLILNIWNISDAIKNLIDYEDNGVPAAQKVTKVNFTGSTNSWAWVKGSLNTRAFGRGRFDTNYPDSTAYPFKFVQFTSNLLASTSLNGVWWPVFEKV